MAYPVAFVIFLGLTAASWFVAVACYRSTFTDHDPAAAPEYRTSVAVAVITVALSCFVPFPGGLFLGLAVWAVAAVGYLDLPYGRSAVLWGYLAVTSVLARLVVIGMLDVT